MSGDPRWERKHLISHASDTPPPDPEPDPDRPVHHLPDLATYQPEESDRA